MKKVVFVTYYWLPEGGVPVQRVLNFARYLPEFGWEPVILTAENRGFAFVADESVAHEFENIQVKKSPHFDFGKFITQRISDKKAQTIPYNFTDTSKNSIVQRLARWIKVNSIPDTRINWYCPTVKRGVQLIKELGIDAIISTSPPQTTHLIAKTLARKTKIPWIADMRDPWTDVFWLHHLKRIKAAHVLDRHHEKTVLRNASAVTTVSPTLVELFQKKTDTPVHLLTNGFYEGDFQDAQYKKGQKFRILYAGSLSKEQAPIAFFTAIKNLINNAHFEQNIIIEFWGKYPEYFHDLIKEMELAPYVEFHDFVQSKAIAQEMVASDLLLLIVPDTHHNKGILTSKIFNYLGANRPIIAFGPLDSDAAKMLKETDSGSMFFYDEVSSAQKYIKCLFEKWVRDENAPTQRKNPAHKNYNRRVQTEKLAALLNDMSQ